MDFTFAGYKPEVIAQACEQYLDAREHTIARRKEEAIKTEMNKKPGFLIFNKPAKTREEAIKRCNEACPGEFFSTFQQIENTGKHWANIVEQIYRQASKLGPTDVVYLSREDADLLHNYIN